MPAPLPTLPFANQAQIGPTGGRLCPDIGVQTRTRARCQIRHAGAGSAGGRFRPRIVLLVAVAQRGPGGRRALEAAAEGQLPEALATLDALAGLYEGPRIPSGAGAGVAIALERPQHRQQLRRAQAQLRARDQSLLGYACQVELELVLP